MAGPTGNVNLPHGLDEFFSAIEEGFDIRTQMKTMDLKHSSQISANFAKPSAAFDAIW